MAERELPSWWLFWGRSAVAIFLDLVQFEGCGVQGGVPVGSPEVECVAGRSAAKAAVEVLRDVNTQGARLGLAATIRSVGVTSRQWARAAELVSTALATFPTDTL